MDFSPTALYDHLCRDLAAGSDIPPVTRVFVALAGGGDGGGEALLEHFDRPEGNARDFARGALARSLLKKYVGGGCLAAPDLRAKRAIDKFLKVNEDCQQYSFAPESLSLAGEQCHGDVVDILYHSLMRWDGPVFKWRDVLRHGYFGPGASGGAVGDSEYEKLGLDVGFTSQGVYQQWIDDRAALPLSAKVEINRRMMGAKARCIDASSLSCVIKNAEIDRTICKEPSLNMFYQLGIGGVLTDVLKRSFQIDLETQQALNRHLARIGSASGRYATIDLSSASDSISRTVVDLLLPRSIVAMLNRFRCNHTVLPSGERVELHMISSMGNGYTFPLQTMIFAAIVRAAYRICGIPYRGFEANSPTFGVNGDDIIVDIRAYNLVIEMLGAYGFVVNGTKTFSTGPFRESCGGDYYLGHYVRGVYATSLDSPQAVVSLINRLNTWSARWGTPLKSLVGYLMSGLRVVDKTGRVRKVRVPLVPRWDTETSGLQVPEVLAPIERRCRDTGSVMYARWAARPVVIEVVDKGPWKRLDNKQVRVNEMALIYCSLSGTLRSRTFSRRSYVVKYESRIGIAPCWEQYSDAQWRDLSKPAVSRQRWTSAVVENLEGILLTPA